MQCSEIVMFSQCFSAIDPEKAVVKELCDCLHSRATLKESPLRVPTAVHISTLDIQWDLDVELPVYCRYKTKERKIWELHCGCCFTGGQGRESERDRQRERANKEDKGEKAIFWGIKHMSNIVTTTYDSAVWMGLWVSFLPCTLSASVSRCSL